MRYSPDEIIDLCDVTADTRLYLTESSLVMETKRGLQDVREFPTKNEQFYFLRGFKQLKVVI